MPEETNTTEQQSSQPPVVIKQGGNGLGTIIAALIIAAAAIYAINVWSTTQRKRPLAATWRRASSESRTLPARQLISVSD